ncbi:IFN protein, partial [Crypturellus undulatus]|nr:IFN protein [Crypturellus undulatus]
MPAPATSQPSLWHRAPLLLLFLNALAAALACTNLRTQQSTFNTDSLQLLRTMAPNRTVLCQQAPFAFPDTLRVANHPQQATATIRHILQQLFNTLSNETIPDHWDRQAHQQLLNKLHHHIHQLQQYLTQCFPESTTLSKRQELRNARLTVNTYFQPMRDFLRTHSHSSCAWDIVRLEFNTCFQNIHNLTRTMT